MDTNTNTSSSPPSTTIHFPLTLNSNNHDHRTLNEMDFFANKKHEEDCTRLNDPSDDHVMELESNVNVCVLS